jgi:hypothetical protein
VRLAQGLEPARRGKSPRAELLKDSDVIGDGGQFLPDRGRGGGGDRGAGRDQSAALRSARRDCAAGARETRGRHSRRGIRQGPRHAHLRATARDWPMLSASAAMLAQVQASLGRRWGIWRVLAAGSWHRSPAPTAAPCRVELTATLSAVVRDHGLP